MKKAIVELSQMGVNSEQELKALVAAKKTGKAPIGFTAKAATAKTLQVTKSLDNPTEDGEEETPVEQPAEPTETQPVQNFATLDQVRDLISDLTEKHDREKAELQQKNQELIEGNAEQAKQIDALQAQIKATEEQLSAAKKDAATLEDLGKLVGKTIEMPNVNLNTSVNASPKGLAGDFMHELQNAKSYSETTRNGVYNQRNGKGITNLIRSAKAEGIYNQMLRDLNEFCKQEFGIFKSAGATTGASGKVPDGFLDMLSAIMRETHNQSNIFWQFAVTVFDETAVPSKSALIPRFNYLPAASLSDYDLSSYNSFSVVAAATGASGDSESLEETAVPIIIKEWGRGKNSNTKPIYIPEFHSAISLFQLLDAIAESRLMQNYYQFEDLLIRSKFAATTKIVFNAKNSVTDDETDIAAAGDLGTMTANFLDALYGYMFALKVPATEDNSYMLVLNPTAITQLKSDLGRQYAPVTPEQMQVASSVMAVATGVNIGQVSGYFGHYCGFHIFASNAFGVGTSGSEGVVTLTLGGSLGDKTARTSYAFGVGAVGRGIGMPMEIRPSGVNPYARGESYIWLSHENTQTIDVDAAISDPANQQTRVFAVQTLDKAV